MVQQSGSVDQSVALPAQRRNDPEAMEGAGRVDGLDTTSHMTVHDIQWMHTFLERVKTGGHNPHLTVRTTLAGGSEAEEEDDLTHLRLKKAELRETFKCHGMGEIIEIRSGSLLIILRIKYQDQINTLQEGTYLDIFKTKIHDVLTQGRVDRAAAHNADIGRLTLQVDNRDLEQAIHFFNTDPITTPVNFLFCHATRRWCWTVDMEVLHGLKVFAVQAGAQNVLRRRLRPNEAKVLMRLQCAKKNPPYVEPQPCLICSTSDKSIYDEERPFGDCDDVPMTPRRPIQETDHSAYGGADAGAAAAELPLPVEDTQPPAPYPGRQSIEQVMRLVGALSFNGIDERMEEHGAQINLRFNAEDLLNHARRGDIEHYQGQPLLDWLGIADTQRLSEGSLLLAILLLSREELKTIKCQDVQDLILERMRMRLIEQRKAHGVPVGELDSLTLEISPEAIRELEEFYAADPIPLPASYVFCGKTCYWYWTADGDIFHRVDVCQVQAGKYAGKRLREHEIKVCWKLWQLSKGPLDAHDQCPICEHRKSNDGHVFPKEAAEHDSSTPTTAKSGKMIEETEHEMAAAGGEEMEGKVEESTGKATEERSDVLAYAQEKMEIDEPSTLESSEKQPEDKEDNIRHQVPRPPRWLRRRYLQYSSSDRAKLPYWSVRGQSAMSQQALITGWFEKVGKLDPIFTGLQITFIHNDDVVFPAGGMFGLACLTSKDLRVVRDQGQWSVWVGGKEPHASPKDRRLLSGRSRVVMGLEEYEVDPQAFFERWMQTTPAVKPADYMRFVLSLRPPGFLHMPPRGSESPGVPVRLVPAIAVPSDEVAGVEPSPNPLYLVADRPGVDIWTPIMVTENPGPESSQLPHTLASISLGASGKEGEEVEGEARAGVR